MLANRFRFGFFLFFKNHKIAYIHWLLYCAIFSSFFFFKPFFNWLIGQRYGGGRRGPPSPPPRPLLLAESFRLLDGEEQLLLQLFVTLVRRQVQPVEAEGQRGQEVRRSGCGRHWH